MMTLFACPKPFTNPHISTIQRNAVTSWTLLFPKPEIILLGDEKGVAEICKEYGIIHIPCIARNEFGTPLVNDIFVKAQEKASFKLIGYINSDIILMDDFMDAVKKVSAWRSDCLMIGTRWDLDINKVLNFQSNDWQSHLRNSIKQKGDLMTGGTDYFIFPRGRFYQIPSFVLGRYVFDNWILWKAKKMKLPLIDLSPAVQVVHQNHRAIRQEKPHSYFIECNHNHRLASYWARSYIPADATYLLTHKGVKKWLWKHYRYRLSIAIKFFRNIIVSFLHQLGLRKIMLNRFLNLLGMKL